MDAGDSRLTGHLLNLRYRGLRDLGDLDIPPESPEIDARDNAITSTTGLHTCASLRRLYLGRNAVRELSGLTSLRQLEVLDLSDNKLPGVQLYETTGLRIVNLAGNNLQCIEDIAGLDRCTRLSALELSRNSINCIDGLHLLRQLPIRLLSLLGNPMVPSNRDIFQSLPDLVVYNAQPQHGKNAEAEELRLHIPKQAGISWLASASGAVDCSEDALRMPGTRSGRPAPAPSLRQESARSTQQGAAPSRPRDSAEEGAGAMGARRPSMVILDSADDMTSGARTPHSSVSEFGTAYNPELPAEEPPQSSHLGLVERQDSANYQPRPPALAERQDSAQNLQALAEAEAELTSAGGAEQAGLARQDSAHELDETTRSPSPLARRSLSLGLAGRAASLRGSLSGEMRTRSPAVNVPSRQDSASEQQQQQSRRLPIDIIPPPAAVLQVSQEQVGSRESLPGSLSTLDGHEEQTSRGQSLEGPAASLEAARRLHQAAGTSWSAQNLPSPFHATDLAAFGGAVRQDSALDSLAEARRAVLAGLPRVFSVPVSSSDPLQQARQLVQATSLASPPVPCRADLHVQTSLPVPQAQEPAGSTLLLARQTVLGGESPYERSLTPLSPRWTLSQLQTSYSQQLPSIASGVPWTASSSSLDQLSDSDKDKLLAAIDDLEAEPGQAAPEQSNLLAEARRVVLGKQESVRQTCSAATEASGSPSAASHPLRVASVEEPADIPAEALPGRDGELIRETPYPDSPLAAGAEGSLRDSTFFQRQASLRGDVAESSAAAAMRSF